MPHDKIKAAARKRMAETGEPYAAARRAVTGQGEGPIPVPDGGYALRMSGEIHDWLADLRGSNPRAAMRVTQALAALMEEGPDLGAPLVVGTADSWPWALAQALDLSWRESAERLAALRRGAADAAALISDIHDQAAELQVAEAKLADLHQQAVDEGRSLDAAQAAASLAAVRERAAEMRRLLPTVVAARARLGAAARRLQARADAFHARKEVLKTSLVVAQSRLKVQEAFAAMFLTGNDRGQQQEDTAEATSAAQALADATAEMERALGQESCPEGLLELRPGAPVYSDIRILFAVEPAGTVLAIAVLEGAADQFSEALLASADMLRRVRAGQAPEAIAHGYASTRSFVQEFYPDGV